MLRYNTQQKQLILPEYGRNIQKMVEYCLTITDRDERTICAYEIIRAMASVVPSIPNNEEGQQKLWDHLAIMSNFQLDIDYPVDIIKPDSLNNPPLKVPYSTENIRYKHYGKNLENLIEVASSMEDSEEKTALIKLVANHMKKLQLNVNPEGVEDDKIFKDLLNITKGQIKINAEDMPLHEFKAAPVSNNKKKKKK